MQQGNAQVSQVLDRAQIVSACGSWTLVTYSLLLYLAIGLHWFSVSIQAHFCLWYNKSLVTLMYLLDKVRISFNLHDRSQCYSAIQHNKNIKVHAQFALVKQCITSSLSFRQKLHREALYKYNLSKSSITFITNQMIT